MIDVLTKEQIKRNLVDIGCNQKQIESFMNDYDHNDLKKLILFLKKQRCCLLQELHEEQKKIDYLDYLVYALNKQML
ncbi:hypothetical protein [Thomasclavelia sp.]|uniref:hypothetical protein n=1 Tax=Thomasclavelia sp. TaxID=3025757 RepID=UPI0025E1E8F2|nr:hypothetical protein [Thomasclavelia sp.]